MGTLLDVNEYFGEDKLPYGHPWQKGDQDSVANKRNPNLDNKDSDKPFGYKDGKRINNSEDYEKIKKK